MDDLTKSVGVLAGVGVKTEEIFHKVGIDTIGDLLYNFPRDYDNYGRQVKIADLTVGNVILVGKIAKITTRYARNRRLAITEAVIEDESGAVRAVWFNQAYRDKQMKVGEEYVFAGKYGFHNGRYQIENPKVREVGANKQLLGGDIMAIYSEKMGCKNFRWQKIIEGVKSEFQNIPELLPEGVVAELKAKIGVSRKRALFEMHFPENEGFLVKARQYLAFEELFVLILAAKLNKTEKNKIKSNPLLFKAENTKKIVENLTFKLTNAQRRATWEILQDIAKETPMNRLLQGDVGSGKTVVAALAIEQVVSAGKQSVVLAPTTILAQQHAESLRKILAQTGVKMVVLTGATKQKNNLKKQILAGEIGLVIGTHAILTDDTKFCDLGLCIIDEQHRFGVVQRQKLLAKSKDGLMPHLLTMTATPIPRSLQLTVFGDLDVSILDELPAGRQKIKTQILKQIEIMEVAYKEIKERTLRGEQVYWICKSVEEGKMLGVENVKSRAKKLQNEFPTLKIEFLHGKMKNADKEAIMADFLAGKIDILVSTTVVEVGVNVPNANLMIIEDADMYGLAQLHQLRGRVGRGDKVAQCFLVIGGESSPSRRLREMERSTDGFYLAEVDLKLRGPGEIYGVLQHGVMDLRIASFVDTKLINWVSKSVDAFLQSGDDVLKYKELVKILKKYQQITVLN